MKFLCDVHIPYSLSKHLEELGHESIHVNFILDKWYTKDSKIAEYADQNEYVLISKDIDFKNSHLLKNSPRKLIRIELGNIPNKKLLELFTGYIKKIEAIQTRESFFITINHTNIQII